MATYLKRGKPQSERDEDNAEIQQIVEGLLLIYRKKWRHRITGIIAAIR